MDFHYGTSFGKASPEAYERLLLDAMAGDATLFARRVLRWRKPGRSSTRSRKPGRRRKDAPQLCRLSSRFMGTGGRRMNCWRAMGAPGGDYDAIEQRERSHPGSCAEPSTLSQPSPCRDSKALHSPDFRSRVGQIDRELKKLWDASGRRDEPAHRSINLAVYSEAPGFVRQEHRDHFRRSPKTTPAARSSSPPIPESEGESALRPGSARIATSVRRDANRFAPEQLSFLLKGEQCGLAAEHCLCAARFRPSASTSGGRKSFHPPIDSLQLWAWSIA